MAEATQEQVRVKREPTGGSTNISRRHLEMARDLAIAQGSNIRAVVERGIKNEYIRKYSKARYLESYGREDER